LGDLDAVHPCQNVDAVWAEDSNGEHVNVVEKSELQELSKVWSERDWDNNVGYTKIDEVDNKEGYTGDSWDEELVAPSNVEEIVSNTEDRDRLDSEDCG
jgi:hypothetical protein